MSEDAPLYKVDHRLVYDPDVDDVLVITYPPTGDNEAIADRVGRSTFAHSTRGYPRQPPSVEGKKKAVLKDPHPTFQVVTQEEAESITARMCKPTFATMVRETSADVQKLTCPGPKTGRHDKQPGKSILKTTDNQQKADNQKKTNNQRKNDTQKKQTKKRDKKSKEETRRYSYSASERSESTSRRSSSTFSDTSYISSVTRSSVSDRKVTFD